jgi:hypothetical protein
MSLVFLNKNSLQTNLLFSCFFVCKESEKLMAYYKNTKEKEAIFVQKKLITEEDLAKELFSTIMMVEGTYVILPLKLVKALGYHTTSFLQHLIEIENHLNLPDDCFFPITTREGYEKLCLTREMQDVSIKKLLSFHLIEIKLAGIPAKRHFKINSDEIEKLMYRTKL